MKVIDKTPFQDEKGNFGLRQRVQAGMEYGFSWQAEVKAQKPVITQLERVLEKGFTLIRNLNLENSKIIEPLILVGPAGVFVLYVTPLTGFFEAKGEEWNVVRNDRRIPAEVNPLTRVARLARALQVYLNRQGVMLPCVVEAVLIAGSPAVHIDVMRPIVRVVLSDAVKQWAASLLQARPVLRPEVVFDVVDRLLNPRSKAPPPEAQPATPPTTESAAPATSEPASRAREIFRAAEDTKPFDPADLDFEFDEQASKQVPNQPVEKGLSTEETATAPRRLMSRGQLIALAVMVLVEFCVLAAFVYLLFFGSP
jgi:hypothetical protein